MRKFILIAGFVLASATAQAGDNRSLSLSGSDPLAASAPAKAADPSQTAEAPQPSAAPRAEAPKEAPKYVERPALVDSKTDQADTDYTKPAATKTAPGPRAEKPRRQRYWTEGRIISELHRHGIYW
jgi:hypothetical protein